MKKLFILLALILLASPCWATNYCEDAANEGCWPLEGNANDSSSKGYNGTVTGATDTTTSPPAAYTTRYYSYDGSGDYISLSDCSQISTNISIVQWLYNDGDNGPGVYDNTFLCDNANGGSDRWNYFLRVDNGDDLLEFLWRDTGGSFYSVKSPVSSYNYSTWSHWAVVKTYGSTSGAEMYENGVAQGLSVNNTGTPATGTSVNRLLGLDGYPGDIDETAVFSDLLSEAEVNDIYDNGLVGVAAARRVFTVM